MSLDDADGRFAVADRSPHGGWVRAHIQLELELGSSRRSLESLDQLRRRVADGRERIGRRIVVQEQRHRHRSDRERSAAAR